MAIQQRLSSAPVIPQSRKITTDRGNLLKYYLKPRSLIQRKKGCTERSIIPTTKFARLQ
jgi:hypothetical protein